MKTFRYLNLLILGIFTVQCTSQTPKTMKLNKLTPEEEKVILHKETERPFIGKYDKFYDSGTYICKQCNAPLYTSKDKFDSHCGWPAFDDEIKGAIKRIPDEDGRRTEIVCANCNGHLGHVFEGEGLTEKNTRHCVNSISLVFVPSQPSLELAYFAEGCFWGTEYMFQKQKGVISTEVGYMGGTLNNPTYKDVCSYNSGHYEALKVNFNPKIVNYETLCKLFFETHDFTQTNGQGPDIGPQYLSVIFYTNPEQKQIALNLIKELENKGYKVATKVLESSKFWKAEEYHQDYYQKNGKTPYCHRYRKIF